MTITDLGPTRSRYALGVFISLLLSACGGDDSAGAIVIETNYAPEVDAGNTQNAYANQTVNLMATASDEDGDELSYAWQQTAGSEVSLSATSEPNISFMLGALTQSETLSFKVTVSDGHTSVADSVEVNVIVNSDEILTHWIMNTDNVSDEISYNGSGAQVNVQYVEVVTESMAGIDVDYVYVEASGIPDYDVLMTQELINELNNRPKASRDFASGMTSAKSGEVIAFGQDIGFNSSNTNCNTTGGDGYWPPGPSCPLQQEKTAYFAIEPVMAAEEEACETGLGTIGLMVNGTSIFDWGDGQSYGNRVWYNLAPIAEQYDVDICGGHAAQGEYHHHFYTSCLAKLVGDNADDHSPLYGFAADGYPVYGPYESSGVLAKSGWLVRDYSLNEQQGGCNGKRDCVLVDPYDVSKGVTSVSAGPGFDETVLTLSGNSLVAVAGFYFEDYYFAGVDVSAEQLDQHNGHNTQDGRGYHYHITVTQNEQGKLIPAFPYTIGPKFKGALPDNAIRSCRGAGGMQPL